MMVNNTKYGGNKMMLNPMGAINDGVIELTLCTEAVQKQLMMEVLDQLQKQGGI